MPGWNRRVGGKHTRLAHQGQIRFGGRPQRSAAQQALQQRQCQQCCVALVHVMNIHSVA